MKKVNILFMGTPEIAVAMLSRLLEDKYRIVGVVTQPDKKIGRKQLLTMPPVNWHMIYRYISPFPSKRNMNS